MSDGVNPDLPAVPGRPDPSSAGSGSGAGFDGDVLDAVPIDVGDFEQGTPASRWALARYLVGRALGESISWSLLLVAIVILALAGLVEWAGSTVWAVLIALVAVGVLILRALLGAVLRRLSAADVYGPVEQRLRSIVSDTRHDVLAELRRVGLPGRTWTLPLLGLRLLRRRRRPDTVARMRAFQIDNVVPKARVDELHLMLSQLARR